MNSLTHMRGLALSLVLGAGLGLAGCGGGDDRPVTIAPPVDPLAEVPASATADALGLVNYQANLNTLTTETREPIDLSNVSLPTSETAEPQSL